MSTRQPAPNLALCSASLPQLGDRGLEIPDYDPSLLVGRIAHIGVGGFHRAHLALYCHRLASSGGDWGITGLGVMPSDERMATVLDEQDHLYTLSAKAGEAITSQVVASIVGYRLVAGDRAAFVDAIARPEIAIVSMTITEAGYDAPADGSNPTFDLLVAALDRRRTLGLGPVTILSCDNLPGNGDVARQATMRAAERQSAELAGWVADSCSFPNSMVDRITPVTTDDDRRYLLETYGLVDRWPVVAEPFLQWVVEDDFVAGRPDFESVGVLMTPDVHAWELYKLRMLNAGHSTIAYLSSLAGFEFVDEVMADDRMRGYLERFLYDEALPTLEPIDGHPREDYIATVLERFANTGIRDQIARLCIDGSAKFPIFLIPTIERQLALDGPVSLSALALAGWAHYLVARPVEQLASDASIEAAVQHARAAVDDPVRFLDYRSVVPDSVARNLRFRTAFVDASASIRERGAVDAVASELARMNR